MRHSTTPVRSSPSGGPIDGRHRRSAPVAAAIAAVALSMAMVACSDSGVDESPAPGGTVSNTGEVRAPNGTSMGATPINAGTQAPGG